ncbi:hypothetical protein COEREDRAFT_96866 [Coemansia reversa NRRL 1564]|uniref:HTH APSES-type domain-containing protein n=1 Tax=Coemansia reversa (strain ATCC 12441 / NRRL 1564) TaxID=763665 RepID=A0A2G5BE59_COERN|nr:hypothetical protein COEREDRAFT_96866 [Coemansia reversa NRRL 1564]|eukprot:PIA17295.1 hypothetical protein COEREDRAFT_96866 [Coemansia reversa NRRL 1564]
MAVFLVRTCDVRFQPRRKKKFFYEVLQRTSWTAYGEPDKDLVQREKAKLNHSYCLATSPTRLRATKPVDLHWYHPFLLLSNSSTLASFSRLSQNRHRPDQAMISPSELRIVIADIKRVAAAADLEPPRFSDDEDQLENSFVPRAYDIDRLHADDARDKVFVAILKALAVRRNKPSSPRELATCIMKHEFTLLGGATPYATVSSRISQHFKRIFEHAPPRPPILGRVAHEKHTRKYFYYVASASEQDEFQRKVRVGIIPTQLVSSSNTTSGGGNSNTTRKSAKKPRCMVPAIAVESDLSPTAEARRTRRAASADPATLVSPTMRLASRSASHNEASRGQNATGSPRAGLRSRRTSYDGTTANSDSDNDINPYARKRFRSVRSAVAQAYPRRRTRQQVADDVRGGGSSSMGIIGISATPRAQRSASHGSARAGTARNAGIDCQVAGAGKWRHGTASSDDGDDGSQNEGRWDELGDVAAEEGEVSLGSSPLSFGQTEYNSTVAASEDRRRGAPPLGGTMLLPVAPHTTPCASASPDHTPHPPAASPKFEVRAQSPYAVEDGSGLQAASPLLLPRSLMGLPLESGIFDSSLSPGASKDAMPSPSDISTPLTSMATFVHPDDSVVPARTEPVSGSKPAQLLLSTTTARICYVALHMDNSTINFLVRATILDLDTRIVGTAVMRTMSPQLSAVASEAPGPSALLLGEMGGAAKAAAQRIPGQDFAGDSQDLATDPVHPAIPAPASSPSALMGRARAVFERDQGTHGGLDFSFHELMDAELMSVNELEKLWTTSNPSTSPVADDDSILCSALEPIPEAVGEDATCSVSDDCTRAAAEGTNAASCFKNEGLSAMATTVESMGSCDELPAKLTQKLLALSAGPEATSADISDSSSQAAVDLLSLRRASVVAPETQSAPEPEKAEAADSVNGTDSLSGLDSLEPTRVLVDNTDEHEGLGTASGSSSNGNKVILPDPFVDIPSTAMVATKVPVSPRIVLTIVETVPVYMTVVTTTEPAVDCQGKWIVRRHRLLRLVENGYVNASSLLLAGGVASEQERSIVLSLEVGRFKWRRPQSKLYGTWIPLPRARALSATCSLNHRLGPFLNDNLESYFPAPLPTSFIRHLIMPFFADHSTMLLAPSAQTGGDSSTNTAPEAEVEANSETEKGLTAKEDSDTAAVRAAEETAREAGLGMEFQHLVNTAAAGNGQRAAQSISRSSTFGATARGTPSPSIIQSLAGRGGAFNLVGAAKAIFGADARHLHSFLRLLSTESPMLGTSHAADARGRRSSEQLSRPDTPTVHADGDGDTEPPLSATGAALHAVTKELEKSSIDGSSGGMKEGLDADVRAAGSDSQGNGPDDKLLPATAVVEPCLEETKARLIEEEGHAAEKLAVVRFSARRAKGDDAYADMECDMPGHDDLDMSMVIPGPDSDIDMISRSTPPSPPMPPTSLPRLRRQATAPQRQSRSSSVSSLTELGVHDEDGDEDDASHETRQYYNASGTFNARLTQTMEAFGFTGTAKASLLLRLRAAAAAKSTGRQQAVAPYLLFSGAKRPKGDDEEASSSGRKRARVVRIPRAKPSGRQSATATKTRNRGRGAAAPDASAVLRLASAIYNHTLNVAAQAQAQRQPPPATPAASAHTSPRPTPPTPARRPPQPPRPTPQPQQHSRPSPTNGASPAMRNPVRPPLSSSPRPMSRPPMTQRPPMMQRPFSAMGRPRPPPGPRPPAGSLPSSRPAMRPPLRRPPPPGVAHRPVRPSVVGAPRTVVSSGRPAPRPSNVPHQPRPPVRGVPPRPRPMTVPRTVPRPPLTRQQQAQQSPRQPPPPPQQQGSAGQSRPAPART